MLPRRARQLADQGEQALGFQGIEMEQLVINGCCFVHDDPAAVKTAVADGDLDSFHPHRFSFGAQCRRMACLVRCGLA